MLTVSHKDIQTILQDFGIHSAIKCVTELQRCDYEHGDYSRKEEIRLIIKAELISGSPVQVGIFDFNRCGDNNLFCDAVMQAVFEARLMDYPDGAGDKIRPEILSAFLKGYRSIRDFSEEQQTWYLYLYAIINAFWSADIRRSNDSLTNAVKHGDMRRAKKWLERIWRRLAIK